MEVEDEDPWPEPGSSSRTESAGFVAVAHCTPLPAAAEAVTAAEAAEADVGSMADSKEGSEAVACGKS